MSAWLSTHYQSFQVLPDLYFILLSFLQNAGWHSFLHFHFPISNALIHEFIMYDSFKAESFILSVFLLHNETFLSFVLALQFSRICSRYLAFTASAYHAVPVSAVSTIHWSFFQWGTRWRSHWHCKSCYHDYLHIYLYATFVWKGCKIQQIY